MALRRRPELGDFLGAEVLGSDLDLLDLVLQTGVGERLERGREIGADSGRGMQRGLDRLAREHRRLVQQLHRVPEEDLRVEVAARVSAQQIVQVERERVVGEPLAPGRVAGGQPLVPPAGVRGDLVQEEVELRDLAAASRDDAIRRHHADDYRAAKHAAHVVVHEPVVEQITHHGGDAGDRERVAHRPRLALRARGSATGPPGGLMPGAPAGSRGAPRATSACDAPARAAAAAPRARR